MLCTLGLAVACALSLASCADGQDAPADPNESAAMVDGQKILESDVTTYIETFRRQMELTDIDAWRDWLGENDSSAEVMREEIIDMFAQELFIHRELEARGIAIEDSAVDERVEQAKSAYGDGEAWATALEAAGLDLERYRAEIKAQLEATRLKQDFIEKAEIDDAELLASAQSFASYSDGARRSSFILFAAGDEALAQKVLDKIGAGELSFQEAAEQYSQDADTAAAGGDAGWDMMGGFPDEYVSALAGLAKGETSGVVSAEEGVYLIACTDLYEAPKATDEDGAQAVDVTSVDQIPADWLEAIRSSMRDQTGTDAYETWLERQREEADFTVFPMPYSVPYYVDMTGYEKSESAEGDSPDDSAEGDGEGSGDDAPADAA